MSDLLVRRARKAELALCHAIRRRVFVEGQGVPETVDRDGRDEESLHLLAFAKGLAIGTARMRPHDGAAKAERVAVAEPLRRSGVGRALMDVLEDEARRAGFAEMILHAQEPVLGFYERLGYSAFGPRFLEADIWHRAMRKSL